MTITDQSAVLLWTLVVMLAIPPARVLLEWFMAAAAAWPTEHVLYVGDGVLLLVPGKT